MLVSIFVRSDCLKIFCIFCFFSGLVPLHNACSYGHYEVTELLLKVRTLTLASLVYPDMIALGCFMNYEKHAYQLDSIWISKSSSCFSSPSTELVWTPWICGSSPRCTKRRLKTEWRSAPCCWATGPTRPCSTATARALWTWHPLLSWRRDSHVRAWILIYINSSSTVYSSAQCVRPHN